ncbi:imidazole glycerol phosphate synthase subunit HisF [bacterium]|nr:imidazole glycerol phosphate synthase subunit HisF [bacterium]MBU1152609.1 imidazole glycerol phosphate synthase subunit HisF [bacterium]MBU2600301.1 imidazole glycerol phosphate synthase subunit HisF [bacterium]
MLAKRIIPCLDVDKGRVVKGVNFVNIRDAGDPVEAALLYNQEGADELVFLDITASSDQREIMIEVVKRTAEVAFMPLTVGGGTRSLFDIERLLKAGADRVSINTAAVKRATLVKEAALSFGSQCIVVAIDAKKTLKAEKTLKRKDLPMLTWEVYIHGGRTPTNIEVISWAKKMEDYGCGEILLTSMDRDGTKEGYDLELTKAIAESLHIPVIASGGAGKLEDFYEVLTIGKANSALAASLFHYRELTVKQVKEYLNQKEVVVRL